MPIQSRFVILANSGSACSTVIVVGSRVMPQMGQFPGSLRTLCECMEQVY